MLIMRNLNLINVQSLTYSICKHVWVQKISLYQPQGGLLEILRGGEGALKTQNFQINDEARGQGSGGVQSKKKNSMWGAWIVFSRIAVQ